MIKTDKGFIALSLKEKVSQLSHQVYMYFIHSLFAHSLNPVLLNVKAEWTNYGKNREPLILVNNVGVRKKWVTKVGKLKNQNIIDSQFFTRKECKRIIIIIT